MRIKKRIKKDNTNRSIAEICKANNLPYVYGTNITDSSFTVGKITAALECIAKIEGSTLGPYGYTTILQNPDRNHLVTKDGYDILQRISFDDDVATTVQEILKTIAGSQVTIVGDGSTSTIIVAKELYIALTKEDNSKTSLSIIAPKDVINMLNYLSKRLDTLVKAEATQVSKDLHELDYIATVANNNDAETGKIVADLYRKIGEFGFVTTEYVSSGVVDEIEFKEGVKWRRGYMDKAFAVSNKGSKIVKHENPLVFLTNNPLIFTRDAEMMRQVIGHAVSHNKEILIVCNAADEDMMTFFKTNRTKHLGRNDVVELKFTLVDINNNTEEGINTLKNLGYMCGCTIYDPLMEGHSPEYVSAHPDEFLGRAKTAIITDKETQIICDDSLLTDEQKKQKDEHIAEIEQRIKELNAIEHREADDEFKLYSAKLEYNILKGISAIYHVGGKTLTEKMSRERLVDDAIRACKSAIENGYVPGGNLIVPKVIRANKKKLAKELAKEFKYLSMIVEDINKFMEAFLDTITNAFLQSYKLVLTNGRISDEKAEEIIEHCLDNNEFYNLKLHEFEGWKDTHIINSTDTDIQIMENTFSIIGILATSNQFVTLHTNVRDLIQPNK